MQLNENFFKRVESHVISTRSASISLHAIENAEADALERRIMKACPSLRFNFENSLLPLVTVRRYPRTTFNYANCNPVRRKNNNSPESHIQRAALLGHNFYQPLTPDGQDERSILDDRILSALG